MRHIAIALCFVLLAAGLAPVYAEPPTTIPRPLKLRLTPAIIDAVEHTAPSARQQQPATTQTEQQQSWVSRNWKWLIPLVIAGAAAGTAATVRRKGA